MNDRRVQKYLKEWIRQEPELTGAKIEEGGCFGRLIRLALMLLALLIAGVALLRILVGRK
jgi:hypothetical protein